MSPLDRGVVDAMRLSWRHAKMHVTDHVFFCLEAKNWQSKLFSWNAGLCSDLTGSCCSKWTEKSSSTGSALCVSCLQVHLTAQSPPVVCKPRSDHISGHFEQQNIGDKLSEDEVIVYPVSLGARTLGLFHLLMWNFLPRLYALPAPVRDSKPPETWMSSSVLSRRLCVSVSLLLFLRRPKQRIYSNCYPGSTRRRK